MNRLHLAALLTVLTLPLGCGNWSNDDLVFLAALPDPGELESKLPGTRVTEGALTQAQAMMGEESEGYRFTRQASTVFNQALFRILDAVEQARRLPPTERAEDWRRWGPWPDGLLGNRRFIRLTMARSCEAGTTADPVEAPRCRQFTWQVEMAKDRTGPWSPILTGAYEATGTLREGTGGFVWDLEAMRGLGRDPAELRELTRLEVAYRTDPLPMQVAMVFHPTATAALTEPAEYVYLETAEGAGALGFHLTTDLVAGMGGAEDLSIRSGWRPDGRGRTDTVLSGGDAALGAVQTECWGTMGGRTWMRRSWDGYTEGDEGQCPTDTPQMGSGTLN